MNKLLLIFTQLISFISLAQLPHGFTWVDNGKFAANGTFKSSVRSVGDHVCFETNILILRDIEGKLEALESLPSEYTNTLLFLVYSFLFEGSRYAILGS